MAAAQLLLWLCLAAASSTANPLPTQPNDEDGGSGTVAILHTAVPLPTPTTPTLVTAACSDPTDCTVELQTAVNTPNATTIVIPLLKHGMPWVIGNGENTSALFLGQDASHRTIIFSPGVVLMAKEGTFQS
jgi:hypothetical protein